MPIEVGIYIAREAEFPTVSVCRVLTQLGHHRVIITLKQLTLKKLKSRFRLINIMNILAKSDELLAGINRICITLGICLSSYSVKKTFLLTWDI